VTAGLIRGPGLCEELASRHRIIQNEKSTHAKPRFIRGGIPANERSEGTAGWRICDVLDASGPPGHTSTMGEKTKLEVMELSR